jgi:transcription-repair coupling factor (superfamily II helicase)
LDRRRAGRESSDELDLLREELVDRCGPTPDPARALVACHRLRLIARPLGVIKIDAGPERSTLHFVKQPPFDAAKLIALVQKDGRIRFAGPDRIRLERAAPTLNERETLVRDFLGRLG